MIERRILLASVAGLFGLAAFRWLRTTPAQAAEKFEVEKTDAEWRAQLTPQQYEILRKQGTERPGSSPLLKEKRKGIFACAGCDLPLFSSETKYERGTGNQGKPNDTKFYSAKNPTFYQISHQEQVLDILRNTTTNPPDRVKEFTLKTSGGSYDKLFDSTVKVLSWDNILWINRTVSTP